MFGRVPHFSWGWAGVGVAWRLGWDIEVRASVDPDQILESVRVAQMTAQGRLPDTSDAFSNLDWKRLSPSLAKVRNMHSLASDESGRLWECD